MKETPEFCANCGASIHRGARACPECGADERTGWAETSVYDGLDLPEDEPDSSGAEQKRRRRWLGAALAALAVTTAILFLILAFGLR